MNYILLPVHNRRAITTAFVQALGRQSSQDFQLVLLDDGSTDGTAEAACALLPERTIVVRGNGDWWWGGALHQGWRWLKRKSPSDDDVIVICNDDVDLPDDFLAIGFALLAQVPDAVFVSKAREANNRIVETCFSVDYRRCDVSLVNPGTRIDCAPTRGLFVRWGQMRKVGGFHPHLLPHYLSDLEWTARAIGRGLTIRTDDRLWLMKHDDTTGVHDLRARPLVQRVVGMFSPKYAGNPLAWTTFIILMFPARYWLRALSRVALWSAGVVLGEHASTLRRLVQTSGRATTVDP